MVCSWKDYKRKIVCLLSACGRCMSLLVWLLVFGMTMSRGRKKSRLFHSRKEGNGNLSKLEDFFVLQIFIFWCLKVKRVWDSESQSDLSAIAKRSSGLKVFTVTVLAWSAVSMFNFYAFWLDINYMDRMVLWACAFDWVQSYGMYSVWGVVHVK